MALTCVPDLPDKPLSPKKVMKSGIGDQLVERVSDEDVSILFNFFMLHLKNSMMKRNIFCGLTTSLMQEMQYLDVDAIT